MREILFRGKTEAGEWVEGFLIGRYDPTQKEHIIKHAYIDNGTCFYNPEKVIPETVGQFTGLTDINGKRIFEGDIVKGAWGTVFVVYFDECYLQFRAKKSDSYAREIDYYVDSNEIEIIGNIHDTPELLTAAVADQKAD